MAFEHVRQFQSEYNNQYRGEAVAAINTLPDGGDLVNDTQTWAEWFSLYGDVIPVQQAQMRADGGSTPANTSAWNVKCVEIAPGLFYEKKWGWAGSENFCKRRVMRIDPVAAKALRAAAEIPDPLDSNPMFIAFRQNL